LTKTAAKTATEPQAGVAKSAADTSAKASAKTAVKAAAKTAEKAAVKAPAKAAAKAPTPAAEPAPAEAGAKAAAAPKASAKAGSKAAAKTAAAPEAQLAPPPVPHPGNRFTDRFAPSPPAKQPDPIEVQKSTQKADPKLVNAWKTKPGRELTEAELMAMPEAEYMNDKQLDFFRSRLQQQKDDLLSNAGETTEHLREDTSIVPDPADRATIEEEHALELRTRDRERKLLKKIAQSLARIDSGEYGFCDETGEPIGIPRLLARPTATLSLEAQQRRELKQKMFGD
jgi:DnaK suppressor protein